MVLLVFSLVHHSDSISDFPFGKKIDKAVLIYSVVLLVLYPMMLIFDGTIYDIIDWIYSLSLAVSILYASAVHICFCKRGQRRTRGKRLLVGIVLAAIIPLFIFVDIFGTIIDDEIIELFLGTLTVPLFFLFWNSVNLIDDFQLYSRSRIVRENTVDWDRIVDLYKLSARELEVLELLLSGKSYQEIADDLFVSKATVKTHVIHIYQKTGVNSKMKLVNSAVG